MTLNIDCSTGEIVHPTTVTENEVKTKIKIEKECCHDYERGAMGCADPVCWAKCSKCGKVIFWDGLTRQWT